MRWDCVVCTILGTPYSPVCANYLTNQRSIDKADLWCYYEKNSKSIDGDSIGSRLSKESTRRRLKARVVRFFNARKPPLSPLYKVAAVHPAQTVKKRRLAHVTVPVRAAVFFDCNSGGTVEHVLPHPD